MKIYNVITIVLLLMFSKLGYGQDSTLFVGNSMVKYRKNHTLEFLNKILKAQSEIHYIEDVCHNGSSLYTHRVCLPQNKNVFNGKLSFPSSIIDSAVTPKHIINNSFHKVLFQETPMTVVDSSLFYKKTIHDFYMLDSLTRLYSNQIYWLEPYAAIYYNRKKHQDLDSLYKVIYSRYEKLKEFDANLINVPIAFILKKFSQSVPKEKFYIGGYHPSKKLQFILACTFYYSMYEGKPEDIPYLGWHKQMVEKILRDNAYKFYQEYLKEYN